MTGRGNSFRIRLFKKRSKKEAVYGLQIEITRRQAQLPAEPELRPGHAGQK